MAAAAAAAESSSAPENDHKPVVVRVKRKASQSRVDAFWLEINERPLKRPLLDFSKLSISDSSSREELKTTKVLVRHVETVTSSEVTVDILQSIVSSPADTSEVKEKVETRRSFRTENKQDQLLAKAKQKQEDLSKNARFEQIWKSRKEKKKQMHDDELNEMCRLYDVIRVDADKKSHEVQDEVTEYEDHKMMSQYLPLLREFMPNAAEEIESDIYNYLSKQETSDGFVYDYYAVKNDTAMEEDIASPFPLVQVDDDDDYYDGPDYSDYESDDSNAENNPMNDYPDEELSEDDDEDRDKSDSSCEDSEVLSRSCDGDQSGSEDGEALVPEHQLDSADSLLDDGSVGEAYGYDDGWDDGYGDDTDQYW